MAIKQRILLQKAAQYDRSLHESFAKGASYNFSVQRKTAFFCHSHHDRKMVEGFLAYFKENGVTLYVDWQDQDMPETPDQETAKRIQYKIRQCDFFFFLATQNSKDSKWCPWEIGYADSCGKDVRIIPTSDDCNNEIGRASCRERV